MVLCTHPSCTSLILPPTFYFTINHNSFTVTKHNKGKGKKHQHHLHVYTTAARLSRRLEARTQEATQGHPSARLQVTQRYVTIRARCLSMLILVPSDASVCRIHRELAAGAGAAAAARALLFLGSGARACAQTRDS